MSGEGSPALLSREEVEALLASAAEGSLREEQASRSSRPFAGQGEGRRRPNRLNALLRCLEDFAEEQGRQLSTQHQIAISFTVAGWEEISLAEFAGSLLEHDRVVTLDLGPGGRGHWMVGRGLLFGWLCLASGWRRGNAGAALPRRPYTRIEERFLRRVAAELCRQLERSWSGRHAVSLSVAEVEEPEALAGRGGGSLLSVTFDVRGMGELCRLRLLLPPAAFDAAEMPTEPRASAPGPNGLAEPLLDMDVCLHVEAGHADLPLARIAQLRPGDLISLERADAEGLLIRIEDTAKFRAERGALGGRLAARITQRL